MIVKPYTSNPLHVLPDVNGLGFTAWSSVREPSQVFVLLEAVYDAFDKIAKRRGIFKVETIGDCYGKFFVVIYKHYVRRIPGNCAGLPLIYSVAFHFTI